jgi:hypothetical protein
LAPLLGPMASRFPHDFPFWLSLFFYGLFYRPG